MRVVKVANAVVRGHIESFTLQYTKPDCIKFIQDGLGNWVTSVENFQNIRYVGIREDLREYLLNNGVQTTVRSLKEALERWGELIDYVAPAGS
jgi:hypothetical protein